MNVNKDSAAVAELPVPWHMRWMRDRALQPEWCVKETAPFAGPDAPFRLLSHALDGAALPQQSYTVHDPANPSTPRNDRDEPIKYKAPAGSGTVIYAPVPHSRRTFRDARTKYIAEGHGKTIALTGLGLPVLGITGIQNWHLAKQDALLPDLAELIQPDDEVVVVPDGDFRRNPDVAAGAAGLLAAIKALGASGRLVDLSGRSPDKMDDLIVLWRGQQRDPLREFHRLPLLPELPQPEIALTSHAALLERPAPTRIVKNLVPPGELTAIVGEPSCGKTFLTMELLLAVARGQAWFHGQRIKRHGLVVHITLEGTSLGARHQAYMRHHGLTQPVPYVALEQPLNMRDDPAWLIAAIRRAQAQHGRPVVLIAVDTVNRAMGGGDENSSVDMGAFLASADKLRAAFAGCGVLLVHHLGKNAAAGARGHSSFTGSVGAEVMITTDEATKVRTVRVTKQRDGSTDVTFSFTLLPVELGKDEDGDAITSCVVLPATQQPTDATTAPTTREIYSWIYTYWTREHPGQLVTKEAIRREATRIRPKDMRGRINKDELVAAWEAVVAEGRWVELPATGQAANTKGAYRLLALPEAKF